MLAHGAWGRGAWGAILWGGEDAIDLTQTASPDSITSSEAWGSPDVITDQVVSPDSIASGESWGSPQLIGPQTASPGSIPATEDWGTPNVAGPVNPDSILSAEAWGAPVANVVQTASPGTIASAEAWGTPRVSHVETIRPSSIASAEDWGSPVLSQTNRPLLAESIESSEAWGSPVLGGGVNTLQVFVGNYDRSPWTVRGSARLTSQTLGRWSGEIEFENIPGGDLSALDTEDEWTPQHGQTILIKEYGLTLFRGCLREINASRPLSTNLVRYSCQMADKTAICDRRLVRKAYPAASDGLEQWDIADVIRDIVTTFLDGEGIVLDPAFPGSIGLLDSPLSPFITVTAAFDSIRDLTGLQWYIDLNQTLIFTDVADAGAAPFAITETSKNWRNLETKISDADYRNRQYVVSNRKILPADAGGTAAPGAVTESYTLLDYGTGHMPFVPDHTGYQPEGATRFIVGYICLKLPISSVTSIKVNGVSQPVYQNSELTSAIMFAGPGSPWWGWFSGTDFVWPGYYSNPGDVIEIQYVPVAAAAVNESSLLVVEQPFDPPPGETFGTCGSGRYDGLEQVLNVGTQEGLDAVAAGLLARSGVIPKAVSFETDFPGLRVGQKIRVDVIRQLIDNLDMFITGITGQSIQSGTDLGHGSSFRWQIMATNFPDVGNWIKTWERLWKRGQLPLPIDRTVAATVVLAPGVALADNSTFNNPYPIVETALLARIVCQFTTPPVDQDLVIDIKVNGVSILDSVKLVVPAGFTGQVILDTFARPTMYLFKDAVITGTCRYRTTGPNPVAARSGIISIQTTA